MMDKSKQAVSIYNKIAESYAKEFSEPSDHIDDFLKLIPKNGKILDVGCGVGVDANYIQSKGFEVVGIDLSEEMLKLAKQKFPYIDFRLMDIRKINFEPNSFDGIFASFSLIHIPKKDIPNILKKFYQILKINGVIYVALHEGKSEEIFVDEPLKPGEKLFLNIYSYKEIKNLLVESKFEIIKKYERKPESEAELNFTKLFIIAKKNNGTLGNSAVL